MMKRCTTCKIEKELTEFSKNKHKLDGLDNSCKVCHKEYWKEYRSKPENKERIKEYHKEYHKEYYSKPEVKERIKEYHKEYLSKPEVKEYHKEYNKEYYSRPEVKEREKKWSKEYKLKINYGITLEQYNEMLVNQNNVCKICNKLEKTKYKKTNENKTLAVDHCHKTGKVRGLLCHSCNTAIGHLKEDIQILQNAIEYIKRNE